MKTTSNTDIKDIIKALQDMLHDPTYSKEDKYHIVLAHNQLMEVFINDQEN